MEVVFTRQVQVTLAMIALLDVKSSEETSRERGALIERLEPWVVLALASERSVHCFAEAMFVRVCALSPYIVPFGCRSCLCAHSLTSRISSASAERPQGSGIMQICGGMQPRSIETAAVTLRPSNVRALSALRSAAQMS